MDKINVANNFVIKQLKKIFSNCCGNDKNELMLDPITKGFIFYYDGINKLKTSYIIRLIFVLSIYCKSFFLLQRFK